ncbi:MAG: hypothetical protein R2867_14055 [Caldilineaceae bacterium]
MADQSIRIILFANGQVGDYSALAQLIRPTDYLIAADGGTHHALTLGRTPHAIIGDLDSVDDATSPSCLHRSTSSAIRPTKIRPILSWR